MNTGKLLLAAAFAAPCLSAHAADVFIGTDTVTIAAPAYSGNKVFEDTYIFDEDGGTLNFTGRQPRMTSGIVVNDNVHAAITSGTSILDVQMRFWTNPSNPDAGRMVLGENSVLEINLGGNNRNYKVRFSNKAYGADYVGTNIAWGTGAKIKLTSGYFSLCNADNNGNAGLSGGFANDPSVELSNYIFNGGTLCTDIGHDIIRMNRDQAIGRVDMDNGNDQFIIESGVKMTSLTDAARQNSWVLFYNTGHNYGYDSAAAERDESGYGGRDTLHVKGGAEAAGINFLFGTNNDTVIVEDGATLENAVIRMNRGDDSLTFGAATIVMDERSYTSISSTATLAIAADIDMGAREAINSKIAEAVDSDNDTAVFNGTTIVKFTDHNFLAMGDGDNTVTFNNALITNTGAGKFVDTGSGTDIVTFNGTSISAPDQTTFISLGGGNDVLNFKGAASVNEAGQELTIDLGGGDDTVNVSGGARIAMKGKTHFVGDGDNSFNVTENSSLALEEALLDFAGEVTLGSGSEIEFNNDANGTLSLVSAVSFVGAGGTICVVMDALGLEDGYVLKLVDADSIIGSVLFNLSRAILAEGLFWDTSAFLTTGSISVTSVPEAAHFAVLAGLAAIGLTLRRRRK